MMPFSFKKETLRDPTTREYLYNFFFFFWETYIIIFDPSLDWWKLNLYSKIVSFIWKINIKRISHKKLKNKIERTVFSIFINLKVKGTHIKFWCPFYAISC